MIEKRIRQYMVTILACISSALFTILAFADDATPSNYRLMAVSNDTPTFTNWDPGNNVWYDSSGVPHWQDFGDSEMYYGTNDLLGNPAIVPIAGAGRSTFYGTTNANTSGNILGGSREYIQDTFDSTFTADANGMTNSDITIQQSTFSAGKTASVTANQGTVMEMYDNDFNGNTTITAASGGTVNLTLGNSTEMQELLSTLHYIAGQLSYYNSVTTQDSAWVIDATINGHATKVQKYTSSTYTYNSNSDQIVVGTEYRYMTMSTFLFQILNPSKYFNPFIDMITARWNKFWDAYYPLRSLELSQYWIAYNTDTGQYDHVNLATVFGYMTWYLGQLYNDASNVTQTMENMTDDINTAATTFQDMEQKEHAVIQQIQSGFESFMPDVTQFQSFRAITWCSNYLQQIYLSLGSYGTVIFIALIFGVCLQFIGYFRYK